MKSILIIGAGRFGKYLCHKMIALGNEVMIVDKDEETLSDILSVATNVQIGDCTKEEILRFLGIKNFDLCFVCIGTNFQSSLEITSLLKDLGAKHVISKASREIHAKFLLRNGADEITDPEKDIAEKLAVRYSADNIFDYIELTKDFSIYEIPAADCWIGKSIKELNFRVKYNVSILATKAGEKVGPLPPASYVFKEDEHLMIMGRHNDVEKILKLID
jgi:trk system potassium uptake protein TrkA